MSQPCQLLTSVRTIARTARYRPLDFCPNFSTGHYCVLVNVCTDDDYRYDNISIVMNVDIARCFRSYRTHCMNVYALFWTLLFLNVVVGLFPFGLGLMFLSYLLSALLPVRDSLRLLRNLCKVIFINRFALAFKNWNVCSRNT